MSHFNKGYIIKVWLVKSKFGKLERLDRNINQVFPTAWLNGIFPRIKAAQIFQRIRGQLTALFVPHPPWHMSPLQHSLDRLALLRVFQGGFKVFHIIGSDDLLQRVLPLTVLVDEIDGHLDMGIPTIVSKGPVEFLNEDTKRACGMEIRSMQLEDVPLLRLTRPDDSPRTLFPSPSD